MIFERWKKKVHHFFYLRIDRYFYSELFPNYLFGLLFFTILMMLNEFFFLIRLYVENNVPIGQVFMLLFNMLPFILTYTIPIGVLPAYLLTMGRFSHDNEFIAMRACGISTLRFIRPGILLGITIPVFSFVFTEKVVVPSNLTYIRLRAKIIAQKPAVELKENRFVEVGGYKIVFDKSMVENNVDVLYNIHVIDLKGRKTIEAEKGRIFTDPENPEHYILKFMNGSISEVMKTKFSGDKEEEKFFVASFRYLSIHTYLSLPPEAYTKGPDTMTLLELVREISKKSKTSIEQIQNYLKDKEKVLSDIESIKKQYSLQTVNLSKEEILEKAKELENKISSLKNNIKEIDKNIFNYRKNLPNYYIMKYHEKFALPLASLGFALISLSLGMFSARSGRNEGLGISIIIMLLFYGLKFGTETLINKQLIPPQMEWFPTLLFITSGLILLILKIRE